MRTIPERSRAVAHAFNISYLAAKLAGADHDTALAIASQQLAIAFTDFQDDLLESQRDTALSLEHVVRGANL